MDKRKINFLYNKEKIMYVLFCAIQWAAGFLGLQLLVLVYKYQSMESALAAAAWYDRGVLCLFPFCISGSIVLRQEGKKAYGEYKAVLQNNNIDINIKEVKKSYTWRGMIISSMCLTEWIIAVYILKGKLTIAYVQYVLLAALLSVILSKAVIWAIGNGWQERSMGLKRDTAKSLRKDPVYISELLEKIEDEMLRKYVAHELYTYAGRARFYKRCYYIFSILALCAPAIAAVVNSTFNENSENKLLISVLSTVATIATGIAGIVKFRESWVRYRSNCEIMKRETTEYVMRTGDYKDKTNTEEEAKVLFCSNLREQIEREEKDWADLRKR